MPTVATNLLARTASLATFILAATCAQSAQADVSLPKIFGDHMVLQQNATLPIWGWADAGEKVTVEFAGQSIATTTGDDKRWRVDLQPIAASNEGQVLTIRGNNVVQCNDVVTGDVWLASGQSNMEFGLQIADGGKEAIAKANDRLLRLFLVPYSSSLQPMPDIAAVPADSLEGKWHVVTPELLSARWGSNGFSAIGYYFGRNIRATTQQPIGIIGCYKGGTAGQTWVSIDGLNSDLALAPFVKRHQDWVAGYEEAAKIFPAKQAAFEADTETWNRQVRPTFITAMEAYNAAAKQAAANGSPLPPKPVPSRPRPQRPIPPDGGFYGPTNLFNAMVSPIVPFAMKGVVWYQGESNTSTLAQALQYEILFRSLILDWRNKWNATDLPFIYVQLAGYIPAKNFGAGNWIWLRESQANVLGLPHTAMASAVDLGDPTDAHPKDKSHIANRLTLAARQLVYGESIIASGPIYASMKVVGNKIQISFTEPANGLTIAAPPWKATSATPVDTTRLSGFTIAGEDRKFVNATATIDNNTVVVSNDTIQAPIAVRYNWSDLPTGNLYNTAGLPALPFRTDDWEPAAVE